MDRKKIIYIGIIIIITVILSITYFSYGFFTSKNEYHGKLNIIAGTLNYELTSNDLDSNNCINIPAKSLKQIEVNIKSLNKISSKYGLYYQAAENVSVFYRMQTTSVEQIDGMENKTIKLVIINNTSINQPVTLTVTGGFVGNELQPVQNYENILEIVMADNLGYIDTYNIGCDNTQCALDKISEMLDTSGNNVMAIDFIYNDTYNVGCENAQCMIDKIAEMVE